MSFRWRYLDADGGQAPGPDVTFDDQTGAQEWLGLQWQDLLDDGVVEVTLLAGQDVVYGPMSLRP
ncbi:MAG: hypothetical protein ACRDRX_10245 [Pseudonocardiaceae bacterium]